MRIWLGLLALLSSAAFAKPSVVLSGPAPVTRWVSKALSKRYVSKIASRPVAAQPTAKEVRDVTAPAGAVALVLCTATSQFITLQVLNGADGTPLDTVSIKARVKKLPRTLPKPQLAALMFAVGSGKAPGKEVRPPPPEPEVAAAQEEPAADEKEAEAPPPRAETKKELAARKREEAKAAQVKQEEAPAAVVEEEAAPLELKPSVHPALRASVGFGGFNRSFLWAGNPSPSLATASQPFSGDISADATWYPGAHFTSSFLAHLGVFVSGEIGRAHV